MDYQEVSIPHQKDVNRALPITLLVISIEELQEKIQ